MKKKKKRKSRKIKCLWFKGEHIKCKARFFLHFSEKSFSILIVTLQFNFSAATEASFFSLPRLVAHPPKNAEVE